MKSMGIGIQDMDIVHLYQEITTPSVPKKLRNFFYDESIA
jgi:hypothetical protein